MGKRKAAKKAPGKKKNEPLSTVFPCLFCNHEMSVQVKLDKKAGVGELNCKVCNQQFQCAVNYLSAAVDVYSEWVDACDAVAQGTTEGDLGEQAPARAQARPGQGRQRQEEEEENDDDRDLIDDTDDQIGYGGDGNDDY